MRKTIHFFSIFFTAIAMSATLAHLFELPNKINLPARQYLTVQGIYRGWDILGIAVLASLIFTAILTAMTRGRPAFRFALAALLCIAATQALFWTFTYPANVATNNWTTLPANWTELRSRWEFSHAVSGCLNLVAFTALTLSALKTPAD